MQLTIKLVVVLDGANLARIADSQLPMELAKAVKLSRAESKHVHLNGGNSKIQTARKLPPSPRLRRTSQIPRTKKKAWPG
jgi:hypothetical protein